MIRLRGGKVLMPEGFRTLDLGIRDGVFVPPDELSAPETIEADGWLLGPGLIDTHLHGALVFDCMDGPDAIEGISLFLTSHGVTSWVPTAVAASPESLEHFLRSIDENHRGARVLGAHLESNFISPQFRGAQPPEALRSHGESAIKELIERYRGKIRILTLAPELPEARPFIRRLREWGIIAACGHSGATYDEVVAGIEAGITRVTHTFNAQTPFRHREPGVVGAALALDALYAEVIADGYHVHPAAVRIAARCKGEKLLLVSDSLRGTGLPPGEYELGGQKTFVDGVARLESGAIAGSVLTLDRAVLHLSEWAGIPLEEAYRAASLNPARSLGLPSGRIEWGAPADLAAFTPQMECLLTLVGGALVYRA